MPPPYHLRKRACSGRAPAASITLGDQHGSSHIIAVARSVLAPRPQYTRKILKE